MVEAFRLDPGLIPSFPLVVIDEVQDFTQLEIELLNLLATKSRVLVAGDDDQSLYGFRHASPAHLHTMWTHPDFATFRLAYCSRCTEVIVAAVSDVVRAARPRGLLANRIDKRYECYLPKKAEDSERFPALIHSRLPRQTEANEIGRYIVSEIARIPERDIAESRHEGYPTALVVGPDPFLEYATDAVRSAYPQTVVTRRDDDPFRIDPLDGYRFLAAEHDSKLGWRILLYCFFKLEAQERLDEALRTGGDIVSTMPQGFRAENEPFVEAIRQLMSGLGLADAQARALEKRLGMTIDEIKQRLLLKGAAAATDAGTNPEVLSAATDDKPSITCATLLGAKGLSGGHVFVAGCVDGFLPRRADSIQNEEVCQFLVALSRTRKECHLISVDSFLGRRWRASSFLTWIQQPLDLRTP